MKNFMGYALLSILVAFGLSTGASAKENIEFTTPVVQTATHGDVTFKVTSQEYKVIYSKDAYNIGTRMFAEYQTQSLSTLEDYAVVQFIRGCQFNTFIDNGKLQYVDNISRYFFGEIIPYFHPKWVIDSVDSDPMYFNVPKDQMKPGKSRHGQYLWNTKGNYEQKGEVYYDNEKPKKPYLYVMDHPGTSFIEAGWAKNISLEFKVCLYKTKDLPLVTAPDNTEFAKPIQCFDWNSSLIFDHSSGTITRPSTLHPHCGVKQ